MTSLTLNLKPVIELTDEQFFQLCQINEFVRFERNPDGTLLLMPLVGGLTSIRNVDLIYQLGMWNQDKTGIAFAATGFILPNGAVRASNVSWLQRDKWNALNKEQQEKFLPVCPDFVVELRSNVDCWQRLQSKMNEYRDNGVQLGWLIDLETQQVEIYRPNREIEVLHSPATLSGENLLDGFILNLETIWY
ncbi:Uma2 family endonuclease [Gloeocapsa sp. BRSZ]